jgi:Septum formation
MSSDVTGDAQPDTKPGGESDQTLPTEIVEKWSGAGAVTVADSAEPTAESQAAEATPALETAALETAARVVPEQPTEAMDAARPLDRSDAIDQTADGEWDEDSADGDWDEDSANVAELPESGEPTELIVMTEPVEMAESVDMTDQAGRRRPRRRWQSLLIALGFLVAGVAIVAGAIAIVGSLTHGFKKPVVVHYTKSAIFSLKNGECIDPAGQTATVVACGTPHDAEVFATFALPGSKWPGTAAVGAAASAGCASRLSGYLNPQLAISLSSTYIYPDSVAWQAGTRTVICEVRATKGQQLTGSVQGANATAG